MNDLYLCAANLYVEQEIPHVCWAIAIADGYDSRDYLMSPAVQEFQELFAAPSEKVLYTGDMLLAVDGDQEALRDFSLWLLAWAAVIIS